MRAAGIARVVWAKELRETLRDRRTLVGMVVLPLVFFPLLGIGMSEAARVHGARLEARPTRVLVRAPPPDRAAVAAALAADPRLRAVARDADVVVEAPGYAAALAGGGTATVRLLVQGARDESEIDAARVREALSREGARVRERRLRERGLDSALVEPIRTQERSISTRREVASHMLARVVPSLLLMLLLMGAMHPAIDVTAGEKERGTLETLLCAPVPRGVLVAGKFLAVATMALLVATVNLASLGLTVLWIFQDPQIHARYQLDLPWARAALLLPIAALGSALVSAVLLAAASLARSFKDAQNVIAPVALAAMLPMLVGQLPGGRLAAATALLPGIGVVALMKAVLVGEARLCAALLAAASTLAWAALALGFAARLFGREAVLFAADPGRRARRPRRAAATPAEALAVLCVVLVLLLAIGQRLQAARLVPGLVATEWLLVLGPVLAFAAAARLDRAALGLVRPRAAALAGAALCGLAAWALAGALVEHVQERVLPLPPGLAEELRRRVFPTPPRPVALDLAAFALSPAICEEVLFRGLLLRATLPALGPSLAILLNAVLFGVFHLSPYRLLPTAAVGLLLALVALRSGSIVPGIALHFLHNAVALVLGRTLGPTAAVEGEAPPPPVLLGAAGLVALGVWLAGRGRPAGEPPAVPHSGRLH